MPTSPADLGPRRSNLRDRGCDLQAVVTKSSPWSVDETVSRFDPATAMSRGKHDPWLGGDIEQALDAIGVPSWVIDDHGRLRWENARARELFGDARGRRIASLFAPSEQQRVEVEVARKLLRGSATSDYRTILQLPSGKQVPVEIHSVVLDDGQSVVGIFGVAEVGIAPSGPATDSPLTPRQHEVLRMLARGCSTTQIAEMLTLSETTVRNHIAALLRALGVHSRLEAVVEGQRRGLVE